MSPGGRGSAGVDWPGVDALAKDTGLLTTSLIATLATHDRRSPFPHQTAVWFARDGGRIVVATSSRSAKARNIASDPRVSLLVQDRDEAGGVWGASFQALATMLGGAEAVPFVRAVFEKYIPAAHRDSPESRELMAADDVVLLLNVVDLRAWATRS
jgi:hypothetical protein